MKFQMDDYSTYQGAYEIFKKVNCIGAVQNCIFGGAADITKSKRFKGAVWGKVAFGSAGFMVGHAIGKKSDAKLNRFYEYSHALFNFTENGVGIMPLAGSKLTINPKKSKPDYSAFIFYSYREISDISVERYLNMRDKIKIVTITLADNNKLQFYAKMVEKNMPYQYQNMQMFVGRYQR